MSDYDLNATISRLFVYPIKSCAGVELRESLLIETGLEFDRAWMVVDEKGEFLSQRELPRMALIAPQLKQFEMVLRAPGMLALHIALDAVEQPCKVRVWDDECAAFDMGDTAAQWFTDFLMQDRQAGIPVMKLRLVRFDPEHKRASNMKWTQGQQALNQFSDGYPVLVISEASLDDLNARLKAAGHAPVTMERFRPNIVLSGLDAHDEDRTDELHISAGETDFKLALIKPCPRCPIPNVNPQTAQTSPEVGQMLQTYRQDARLDGAITFGMNAMVKRHDQEPFDLHLAVGQTAQGQLRF
ncbi:MOSC N-terminal beta barrel domain-containing protein [Variovorax sp. PCZ-1]|uniref:MOSC domain-containing protein n=1 Tax=Variovorax sp. PCZ-1 TaxID=2835533 RepID=UPI001BCBF90C|nr:MOSC N-terminal beta barrel domain-containing protein [Variovorax sp. PCZ-1]MBS7808985.1 MOSC N-terminal beta barrel domain-containing protein [Variovorax sp. PCZ-1]